MAKSFTPDLPGNFAGGLVQLNTIDFPQGYSLRFSTGASVSDNLLFQDKFISTQGGSLDWLGFNDGLAEIKNNTFIGIKGEKYFYFGSKTKESEKTNLNWFNSPENANEFISGNGNIANYANISNLFPAANEMHTLNLIPTENANYSKTASFATEKLSDTFFENVTFRGAFSHDIAHRWDANWANYDPVNTVYKAKSNVEEIESTFANNIQINISPNPVANTCLVRYENPSDANVSIKIYNEMGEIVQQIASGVFQARGVYEFRVNANELTQGTYFINICNDKTSTTKTLRIVK